MRTLEEIGTDFRTGPCQHCDDVRAASCLDCFEAALNEAHALGRAEGYAQGAEAMREEAISRAESEEECPGDIPESLRSRTVRDPAASLRAAVRATKIGIADGIRTLPIPTAPTKEDP